MLTWTAAATPYSGCYLQLTDTAPLRQPELLSSCRSNIVSTMADPAAGSHSQA